MSDEPWHCPDCETDWKRLLDTATEAMHRRNINYCPVCGYELNNPLQTDD